MHSECMSVIYVSWSPSKSGNRIIFCHLQMTTYERIHPSDSHYDHDMTSTVTAVHCAVTIMTVHPISLPQCSTENCDLLTLLLRQLGEYCSKLYYFDIFLWTEIFQDVSVLQKHLWYPWSMHIVSGSCQRLWTSQSSYIVMNKKCMNNAGNFNSTMPSFKLQ